MGFQNQGLQSAAPVSTSSTQFVSNESSQSGFQSSPQGVLLLPRGEVVHILPTALPQQPHALPLIPAAALFTSVVGALLQSQNTTHNDIETPITDPVLILTSKVVRVEWPESEGRQGQYSSNGRKHRKKRSKKPKSDSSDKFDGSSFFILFLPQVQRIRLILNLLIYLFFQMNYHQTLNAFLNSSLMPIASN